MSAKLRYFFRTSFRRKLLDLYQERYASYYRGRVVDIGGRDRGKFKKPREKVIEWIFVDIVAEHNPDVVADVADMNMFKDNSFDVVSALELFEHVENIEKGVKECVRILKPGGHLLISMPFLFPVHGDPFDYQRWTSQKWENVLRENGMNIIKIEVMGRSFTVFAEIARAIILEMPSLIRKPLKVLIMPLLACVAKIDYLKFVQSSSRLKNFHGGYFIIASK